MADMRHPKVYTDLQLLQCIQSCKERGDEWASGIEQRMLACIDLVAAKPVYRDQCFSRFMLNKDLDPLS